MSFLLTQLKNAYVSIRGFHTQRHIVVIESDDWGSIRTPSAKTLNDLENNGDDPGKDAFLRNDCLESETDLNALFGVLSSVKDCRGNPAVVTANFAMANPDFDNINLIDGQYAFEPFYKTYDKYYPGNSILKLIKRGIDEKLFCPQLHCREHLNVNRWIRDLRNGDASTRLAFKNHMIGIGSSFRADNPFGYMDSFNTDCSSDDQLAGILEDAANMFVQTFRYPSKTFVASCYVWNAQLESALGCQNIRGIQTSSWQNVPVGKNGEFNLKRKLHYTGEKNKFGHIYTVRNCEYEPAYMSNPEECADKCFAQVVKSFKHRKPAIINTHRFNYIGRINPGNSEKNLVSLKKMLQKIVSTYSDVEFLSTPQLLDIILGKKTFNETNER